MINSLASKYLDDAQLTNISNQQKSINIDSGYLYPEEVNDKNDEYKDAKNDNNDQPENQGKILAFYLHQYGCHWVFKLKLHTEVI